MADGSWLVVGLGNPGPEYDGTRHNIGFACADQLGSSWRSKFGGLVAERTIAGERVVLLKPQGYMNCSGVPTQQCASFYKVPPERIVVIHDDLDLKVGALRVKLGGGDGGHNGLRSITELLGSGYLRLRIGVGRPAVPEGGGDRKAPAVVKWVLGRFSREEEALVAEALKRSSECLSVLLTEGVAVAQNRFHGTPG